ncbi:unnamed protein product [Cunninghamella blakesleeana]
MSFTDANLLSFIFNNNDIKLNVNQNTIDLLNAALASHSQANIQQQLLTDLQNDNTNNTNNTATTTSSTSTTTTNNNNNNKDSSTKRTIDSTDESDATATTTPKRPGRKPLDKTLTSTELALDPKQKRKAQNRAAQRAFRERKEKHVSELQERIKELEELASKNDEDLIQENKRLKEQLRLLEEENYALKDAKFTFEFPLNNNSNTSTSTSPTTTNISSPTTTVNASSHHASFSSTTSPTSNNNNDQQDDLSGNSSSCTEQSPLSMGQEEDSDTPVTKTPSFQDDPSTFLTFGSIAPSQDFDFLAVPGGGGIGGDEKNNNSSYDVKKLFQGKDDLFTGYRAPSSADEFAADDFLLDGGLPALFGSDDTNLFGFSTSNNLTSPTDTLINTPATATIATSSSLFSSPLQQENNNNNNLMFSLDQFYVPSEGHIKKEELEASLYQAKENGVRAYEVQKQLTQIPDFNLDSLCDELKKKACCSESKYVLTQHDVESYLKCFDQA